jgi:uncharacterized protein YbjT (DUF2867 family)
MKAVVIGGTGLIGSRLVEQLRRRGHEALAASPDTGVNTLTGEGLEEALAGAEVVIDVSNSPSFEASAVLHFFDTSTRTLLAAEKAAGVTHHVALSVVGADRLPLSGYLRAKVVQENLVKSSGMPFSILRSTQFFEFMGRIAESATEGDTVRVPVAFVQPVLSSDVVATLAEVALGPPLNGTIEIAGPEKFRMDDLVRHLLDTQKDARTVRGDIHAQYFGTELEDESLVPLSGTQPRLGATRFDAWFSSTQARP